MLTCPSGTESVEFASFKTFEIREPNESGVLEIEIESVENEDNSDTLALKQVRLNSKKIMHYQTFIESLICVISYGSEDS